MIKYRLRDLMRERGVTYRQVSKGAGVAVRTLQKVANDETVQTDILERLCRYFDIDINQLVVYEKPVEE